MDTATDDTALGLEDLALALGAANVGVWRWDASTGEVLRTRQCVRLLGFPEGATRGSFDDFAVAIHEGDRARVLAAVERTMKEGGPDLTLRYRILVRGAVRWIEDRARVLCDARGAPRGMLGVVLDVTEEREQSELLRANEERARLYSELASDYVYEVDLRASPFLPRVVWGAFERTTGYTLEALAEAGGWMQILHPDDRKNLEGLLETLAAGRTLVNEYRILSPSGDVRWLRDRVRPVVDDATGALVRLVGGVQDITDVKALEERLAHANKLEALARLAGAVAHDFNNLLTIMMTASAMLPRPNGDAGAEIASNELSRSLTRAADLTRSLLTFARRQPNERRVTAVSPALQAAMSIVRRAVGERVVVELTDDTGAALVPIGGTQLDLLLLNLAVNARDAMPDGGRLEIRASQRSLRRGDRERPPELEPGEYVAIEVADTGTGMGPEVLSRIFEPFFSTKGPDAGTGLGLASVHGITRQLGGAISVESKLGHGSTFTLYLPVTKGKIGAVDERGRRHAVGGTEPLVLVEDEPTLGRVMRRALVGLGYRVELFESAEAALAHPTALAECAVLVSDVRLPGAPGTELALEVRRRRPTLPVLLMSAHVEDERQREVVASGAFAFLAKPFAVEGLAAKLRELLDPPSPAT